MTYAEFLSLPAGSVLKIYGLYNGEVYIFRKLRWFEWKNENGGVLHEIGFRNWFAEGGRAELMADVELLAMELRDGDK